MTNGASGDALISRIRRMIKQEYKWDVLDAPEIFQAVPELISVPLAGVT